MSETLEHHADDHSDDPLPTGAGGVRENDDEGTLERTGEIQAAEGAPYTVYYSQLRDLESPDDSDFSDLVSANRGTVAVDKPFKIRSGHYFCLGDNRDDSEDSRFWGEVARENIVGRAMFVYWSVDKSSQPGASPALFDPLTRIRWKRIGTLIQ